VQHLKIEFSLVRLGCVRRVGAVLQFLTEFGVEGMGVKMVIVYCPCPPKNLRSQADIFI
jgi:hypothetical protein